MKAEIVTSYERDKKHYLLLEVEQEQYSTIKNGYFEADATIHYSIKCPVVDDFKIKAWVKNDFVNFEIYYHEEHYKLKFQEGSCSDFENLELFKEDMQPGVTITVYLTNLFVCAKNGALDFRMSLWAKCRNADHKIGIIKDSIKL